MASSAETDGFLISWFEIYMSENEGLRGKSTEPLQVTDLVDHNDAVMEIVGDLQKFCHAVLAKHV